jgi:diacylglycerol kinase family enzyme
LASLSTNTTATTWCVLVNRVTCATGWKRWEKFLTRNNIAFSLHHSFTLDDAARILTSSYQSGNRHYLLVGGDGTIHHGVNILMQCAGSASYGITIGVLPCGTGNDWVRSFGNHPSKLAQHIRDESTAPMNIVKLTWPDGRTRYAANMVGGALDAAVVSNLKRASVKIPSYILYPFGLLKTLMKPHTWKGTIQVDHDSISGEFLTIQAGFSKYCGGGMYVLPHAREDSPGLLIMRPKKLSKLLFQIHTIYNGRITEHKEAIARHFEHIDITHDVDPIPIEADGEFLGTSPVRLDACYDALKRIV